MEITERKWWKGLEAVACTRSPPKIKITSIKYMGMIIKPLTKKTYTPPTPKLNKKGILIMWEILKVRDKCRSKDVDTWIKDDFST